MAFLSKSESSLNVVKISSERCLCVVVFAQNFAILKQSSLPHVSCLKHPEKIAWHEPNDVWFDDYENNFLHYFNSDNIKVVDVLGRPGQASSLTSSRPSLNWLYHNLTCVLFIGDSPNATGDVIHNLIEEHTKTRLNFLFFKNKLTIQNGGYCQHI